MFKNNKNESISVVHPPIFTPSHCPMVASMGRVSGRSWGQGVYLDGSGRHKRDDLGVGLSLDQQITNKTTLFFRYGWADDKVNEMEDFVSFGFELKGLIEGLDRDIFAVGYANGLRSPDNLGPLDERELDLIELYYRIQVNDHLHISPNVQFVMDPGNRSKESPATVFGARCRYTF